MMTRVCLITTFQWLRISDLQVVISVCKIWYGVGIENQVWWGKVKNLVLQEAAKCTVGDYEKNHIRLLIKKMEQTRLHISPLANWRLGMLKVAVDSIDCRETIFWNDLDTKKERFPIGILNLGETTGDIRQEATWAAATAYLERELDDDFGDNPNYTDVEIRMQDTKEVLLRLHQRGRFCIHASQGACSFLDTCPLAIAHIMALAPAETFARNWPEIPILVTGPSLVARHTLRFETYSLEHGLSLLKRIYQNLVHQYRASYDWLIPPQREGVAPKWKIQKISPQDCAFMPCNLSDCPPWKDRHGCSFPYGFFFCGARNLTPCSDGSLLEQQKQSEVGCNGLFGPGEYGYKIRYGCGHQHGRYEDRFCSKCAMSLAKAVLCKPCPACKPFQASRRLFSAFPLWHHEL